MLPQLKNQFPEYRHKFPKICKNDSCVLRLVLLSQVIITASVKQKSNMDGKRKTNRRGSCYLPYLNTTYYSFKCWNFTKLLFVLKILWSTQKFLNFEKFSTKVEALLTTNINVERFILITYYSLPVLAVHNSNVCTPSILFQYFTVLSD